MPVYQKSAEAQLIPLTEDNVKKLESQMETIIATLPNDLQSVLQAT